MESQGPKKEEQRPAGAMADIPAREQRQLARAGFTFVPQTWEQLFAYAKEIANTDFVPNDFKGKPGAVLAVWQIGQEIGLPPMTALQSICIINGRPSVWGDGALAVVRNHPLCEWVKELPPDETVKKGFGECTVKRKGDPEPTTRRFTIEMAEKAGLWGGKGKDAEAKSKSVWATYPGRMLQMRARAWAIRDAIPEALKGVGVREEIEDIEPTDITPPKEEPLQIPQAREEEKTKSPVAQPTTETASDPRVEGARQPLTGDKKAVAFAWIEKTNDGDFLAEGKEWLGKTIKGMSGNDQMEICRAFQERDKKIKDGLKAANTDS